ncbi:MAG: ABC transporter ATP-binding protein [Candidatus Marinimicrobia bacterium]|jgi:lipoprotein-releasing system ATP-binding protein|nr:ABC transporter ATP-binding protein [Candidatus Neomarinimicrobiota bacterium]MDP6852356.1 ABC transporter ATP-binding protein [Candidatus Neomarinimicrobiota bacterium]
MAVIKSRNIVKSYLKNGESVSVLKGADITIERGQIVVLMGPSGSGKSTLLNILGTLDSEYEGAVEINGKEIISTTEVHTVRTHELGFVFQFHHLLPEFTLYENLLIPGLIANMETNYLHNQITNMIEFIGMEHRIQHYPNEVSGGERQRIAVLRALVNQPALVLADEPTGNLDRENSKTLLNLMSDLKAKFNQSFLIASHDESILQIADEVLYLKDGKIIKDN